MSKQLAQGSARDWNGCLARSTRGKPRAVNAGNATAEIGHGSKQGGTRLRWRIRMGPIEAVRVKAQRSEVLHCTDTAVPQVSFSDRSGDRLSAGEEPLGCLGRSPRDKRTQAHRWRRAGEVQEISRFLKSLTKRG